MLIFVPHGLDIVRFREVDFTSHHSSSNRSIDVLHTAFIKNGLLGTTTIP